VAVEGGWHQKAEAIRISDDFIVVGAVVGGVIIREEVVV